MSGVLRVERPGVLTTIQDLGRARRSAGVPPGGAMDRFSLIALNRLLGNQEGAPALECTVNGPDLLVLEPCLVAVGGGDFQPRVNNQEAPLWESLPLTPGDRLHFLGRRQGARCYVALQGGVAGERWLGSASTCLLVGRGGRCGRPLVAGDELERAHEPGSGGPPGRRLPERLRPRFERPAVLAALPGPHLGRLDSSSRRALFGGLYTVGTEANRMGYRLEGAPLSAPGPELVSLGLALGAVQVTPGGTPILLMADHQTAGGYPVAACLASIALPAAAQLLPGDQLVLAEIGLEEAQRTWQQVMGGLAEV